MPTVAALAIAVHALSAIYGSGCTFVAARGQDVEIDGRYVSQLGAAILACVSGGALFALFHRGGPPGVLVAGAVAAVVALLAQVVLRSRRVLSNRIAALLLALAAVSMVVWKHV